RIRVRSFFSWRITSWPAAKGMRWVNPSIATETPSGTRSATASRRVVNSATAPFPVCAGEDPWCGSVHSPPRSSNSTGVLHAHERTVCEHNSPMAMNELRTQVAVVGGGPAGSLLAYLLRLEGIDSVVIERRSRDYVLGRVRAGVIEHGTAQLLRDVGLGERMDAEGFVHDGLNLAFGGPLLRIDFRGLIDRYVVIYGQTQPQRDLYAALDRAEIPLLDESDDVTLDGIEGTEPTVTFRRHGETHTIRCDYVAGCDGVHGVTPQYIPGSLRRTYERIYPFVWVGVLSPTPPVNDELIYANHETGFALCSMRNEHLSRYYVQGSADDSVDDWPDDRFWETLSLRLPPDVAETLVT